MNQSLGIEALTSLTQAAFDAVELEMDIESFVICAQQLYLAALSESKR